MKGSILLVDDEVAITQALKRTLRTDGHQVFTSQTADSAMTLLSDQTVDVVISDQRMPQIQGCNFLSDVHRHYPNTIRMMMSGHCDFAALTTAINDGHIDQFIQKPWENNHIRALINSALEKKRQLQWQHKQLPQLNDMQKLFAAELPNAIHRQEFLQYLQPIYCMQNKQLYGVELLIRWKHPKQGILTAQDFIPAAEQHGLLKAISTHQFDQVFTDLSHLLDSMYLSINLSPGLIMDDDFWEYLRLLLEQTPSNLNNLIFEITETESISDLDKVAVRLQELREHGIKIALDDFCTGFSSLDCLRTLPVDIIKLDKTFTANTSSDCRSLSIIWSLLELARELNINVIAEGIESEDQAKRLDALGCHLQQGYWHSRPMSVDSFFSDQPFS